MKNLLLLGTAICCVCMVSSCKSKSSAYKAAYEQAKLEDDNYKWEDDSEVLTTEEISYESPVKQERVRPASESDAAGLKNYSVVIGSFRNRTNAYSLKERMIDEGYRSVVAQNDAGWYRVIVTSFDNREDAARSRDVIKSKYRPNFHDAWVLKRQY